MVRVILIGVVLLLVSPLMTGCGVAQKEYDRVTSDLSVAQEQIKTTESDLNAARAQTKTLESDLSAAQAQTKTLESDLSTAQGKIKTLESNLSTAEGKIKTLQADYDDQKAKIAKAAAYAKAFHIYLYPARLKAGIPQKLDFASNAEWLAALTNSVQATGDDELLTMLRTMQQGGTEGNLAAQRFMSHTAIMVLRFLE